MFELKKELEHKVPSKVKSEPHYLVLLDYIANKELKIQLNTTPIPAINIPINVVKASSIICIMLSVLI